MKIEYLNKDEYEIWDDFVSKHAKGNIFHTSKWLRNQSGEFKIIVIKEDSIIVAGFAFIVTKKAWVSGIFKPPYTPYFHPLIKEISRDGNSEKEIEILTKILKEIAKYNTSLIFDSNTKYFFPYQNHGFKISPKVNYTVDPSLFMTSIAKRKKSSINKYIKEQNKGNLKIVEDFNINEVLSLWIEFGKSKSLNVYKDLLFEIFNSESKFTNWGCVKIFSKEEKLLAAGLYLFDDKKLYNLIPIVNYQILSNKEKNIGDYLYYKLSIIAEDKGLILDYEGSDVEGVEKMYRRLGGSLDLKHTATKFNSIMNLIYFLNRIKNLII